MFLFLAFILSHLQLWLPRMIKLVRSGIVSYIAREEVMTAIGKEGSAFSCLAGK
jgi:hypothetical protein